MEPDLIEDYYQRWLADPSSVDDSWRIFFEGYELGRETRGPAGPVGRSRRGAGPGGRHAADRRLPRVWATTWPTSTRLKLNPPRETHELLEPAAFGLTEADLDRVFYNRLS